MSLQRLAVAASPSPSATVDDTFPQGCQFSPDGLCVLTSRGHRLELYNNDARAEKWTPVFCYPQGGNSVRSYAWYPPMHSLKPETCCFAAASRDGPVHLFDCYVSNQIRATYSPYNRMDELESPNVIRFLEDGQRLLTGGFHTDRMLQVFDVHRPGRHPLATLKLGKTRRSKDGQKGIVSALASCHDGVIAVGTVSPGSIYLYDVRTYCQAPVAEIVMMGNCMVGHGKRGNKRKRLDQDDDSFSFAAAKQHWYHQKAQCGVTQMEFTDTDGNYLFSTSRRSSAIVQWDLRKLSCSNHCPGVASYAIENDTNQRIAFALHNDRLYAGGTDGCVRVYDLTSKELIGRHAVCENDSSRSMDVVNGVSVTENPVTGKILLATAIGSRHFPTDQDWENDDPYPMSHNEGSSDTGSLQIFSVESATAKHQNNIEGDVDHSLHGSDQVI